MDLEVFSSDLKNGDEIITANNIEILRGNWLPLSTTPSLINISIAPGLNSKEGLSFRVKIPQVVKGNYEGNIEIIGLEK